jgi:hypothetical protein
VNIDGVYVPGEGYCKVAAGTEITKIKVFAGKGTEILFRNAPRNAVLYGGNPEDWQKVRGQAMLERTNGEIDPAELHWAQAAVIGEVGVKFKRWLI